MDRVLDGRRETESISLLRGVFCEPTFGFPSLRRASPGSPVRRRSPKRGRLRLQVPTPSLRKARRPAATASAPQPRAGGKAEEACQSRELHSGAAGTCLGFSWGDFRRGGSLAVAARLPRFPARLEPWKALERRVRNAKVRGSIPLGSTNKNNVLTVPREISAQTAVGARPRKA